jgi:hypothetical protein
MDLRYLLEQPPILDSMLLSLGPAELFVLRYIAHGIERPTQRLLCAYAEHGDLKLLRWAYEATSFMWQRRAIHAAARTAAKHGHLELIKWIISLGVVSAKEIGQAAATHGQLKIIKYMHNTHGQLGDGMMDAAEHSGNLGLMKWLRDHKYSYKWSAGDKAAKYGYSHIIGWLYREKIHMSEIAGKYAAENDRIDVLITLHSISYNLASALDRAIDCGNIISAKLLLGFGYSLKPLHLEYAAMNGDIAMFDWLLENGLRIDCDSVVIHAAHGGQKMVEHVLKHGALWSIHASIAAAQHGHVDVIVFALERGFEIDVERCRDSLKNYGVELPD